MVVWNYDRQILYRYLTDLHIFLPSSKMSTKKKNHIKSLEIIYFSEEVYAVLFEVLTLTSRFLHQRIMSCCGFISLTREDIYFWTA